MYTYCHRSPYAIAMASQFVKTLGLRVPKFHLAAVNNLFLGASSTARAGNSPVCGLPVATCKLADWRPRPGQVAFMYQLIAMQVCSACDSHEYNMYDC